LDSIEIKGVVVWEFILFYPCGDVTLVYFKGQTFELSSKGFFNFVLFCFCNEGEEKKSLELIKEEEKDTHHSIWEL
jgi:hypothetical protein